MKTPETNYRFRALEPDDVDWVLEVENDPELSNLSDRYAPLSRYQLMEYALNYSADPFRDGQLRLIMVSGEDDTPVAIVDLYEMDNRIRRAYVGIVVCNGYRKRGIGGIALRMLSHYARTTLRLDFLAARIPVSNIGSRKTFADEGYEPIAVLPEWYAGTDGLEDLEIWRKSLR